MNRGVFNVAGILLLVGVFVIGGGIYQPGPAMLWTGDACPQPTVTCGTLPLGVIGAIAAGVVIGGRVFYPKQEVDDV